MMSALTLMVLYPPPSNAEQFEQDYQAHLQLLHEKLGIPLDQQPYQVLKMLDGPTGPATFYQQFSMPFHSAAELKKVLSSQAMQDVAADANRISSGGAPLVLIGEAATINLGGGDG
jgi:hypothetical protein